jgi:hypothetical protein
MNAELIIREMELAAYEMAEAETSERRAHKLRLDATKRIASVRQDMILALEDAKARKDAQQS